MTISVSATFVDGVLKPDQKLDLPDHARVNVTIQMPAERSDALAAWESLQRRLREHPIHLGGERFTRDELHERR